MPVHNEDVARTFDTLADMLELQQTNPFRIRAYRDASRTIRSLGTELGALIREGRDLDELPGIGEDLAGKIREIVQTGKLSLLDEVRRSVRARTRLLLELNAQPDRLDLDDVHCQMAKAEGVLISIASDAHRVTDFGNIRFGITQARRGWLEWGDVLNTRSLPDLRRLLAGTV